ncbi:hypothetical protein EPO66_01605 [bacterium]|nr:MAG: hypothetical protein EPO66_01605 [bacterium]
MFKKPSKKMLDIFVTAGSFVVILFILYLLVGRNVSKYEQKMKELFKDKQAKLTESENLVKAIPNPQKAIEEMETKAEDFKEMGFSRKQIPRLVQMLGQSAGKFDITVNSIRPRDDLHINEADLPAGVNKVYIEMIFSTPYRALGDYIKSLGELPISFVLESINLERDESSSEAAVEKTDKKPLEKVEEKEQKLTATLILSTYMVLEI